MTENEPIKKLTMELTFKPINEACIKTDSRVLPVVTYNGSILRDNHVPKEDIFEYVKNVFQAFIDYSLNETIEGTGTYSSNLYINDLAQDIKTYKDKENNLETLNFYLTLKIFDSENHNDMSIEPVTVVKSVTLDLGIIDYGSKSYTKDLLQEILKNAIRELFNEFVEKYDISNIIKLFK